MDREQQPKTIRREDYRVPAYLVDSVELQFDLDPEKTSISSRLQIRSNTHAATRDKVLVLDGEGLDLQEIRLDGRPLAENDYQISKNSLAIPNVPDQFVLETTVIVNPSANTALEGLYISSENFCTQCEAEGFRRITYYPDRPDVLARFDVIIRAESRQFPVLLSNGNRIAEGRLADGRHWAQWQDPFPKPSYLFALVAGDLVAVKDHFVTASGRGVNLEIYVQAHNRHKCEHAMRSLKQAMRWDEQVFGLEYDLDNYMIVVVDDFNMGAMENKGLNIFNSKFVLASPETATDDDYQRIEGVIAHEYFHNWTGNRVTCRDWFQLSLKEGLTVFRDQEFSADMSARAVKRIQDVQLLRTVQFAEDAGPMAHPVRPDSYIEINNFYTVTVYEKGAELIRMQHKILGAAGFKKGLALYFQRHDGQAVTIEDFVAAMESANNQDLRQFRCWYGQAGTPSLQVSSQYDAATQVYALRFTQIHKPSPGQDEKLPLHIPLEMGLLAADGSALPLTTDTGLGDPQSLVLNIKQQDQTFRFINVQERPVPSLLRGFSAPVKLMYDYSNAELKLLMTSDIDSFCRWQASDLFAERVLLEQIKGEIDGDESRESEYLSAYSELLQDYSQDKGLITEALSLPTEQYLAEQCNPVDPQKIHSIREALRQRIASDNYSLIRQRYLELREDDYQLTAEAIAGRALKNLCLSYLMCTDRSDAVELCVAQYRMANNMTDRIAALRPLVNRGGALADDVLDDFYRRFVDEALVLDKWFAIQASSRCENAFDNVLNLTKHPAFSLTNPNRVRSLVGVFSQQNPRHFHGVTGKGYQFLADHVLLLNDQNPQIAARLVAAFNSWRRLVEPQQQLMRQQLQRIHTCAELTPDVFEIVDKAISEPSQTH